MFFKTTEQHENLREKIREFAEEEVKPIAFMLDQENKFPSEVIQKLADMGVMGIPYPKEYGGSGLDVISYAIAVEELSRVDGGTETTAVLDGNYYILNGEKIFITNGGEADIYIVFAVTTPNIGTRGISTFIVEKGSEGFSFGKHYDKMGIRSSATAELIFNDVKVPKENLLGKEGDGFKIAMSTLDGGRIGISAQALGIAQGAYEHALEYSKERVQFGKPICQQQVIAFKLADMATKLRAARLLIYSAAELKENHEHYSTEAAMAKQYASDVCLEIVNDALQIFGGSGYLKGMEVERAYRDAKICTIYEGTNEIQRVVIAANIIGKMPKTEHAAKTSNEPATGYRKKVIYKDGSPEERVNALVEALKKDGYDFTVGIPIDTLISKAERVVSVGQGIGEKENMHLIKELAVQAGAAIGSSRPVAETLKYVPLDRYVGMSGQKFKGNLYIACGISGAGQHLKGIKDASTIVAININPNAKIFKNADYGIVGDLMEVLPLLTSALDSGEPKKEAPPMKKMKRAAAKKVIPTWKHYVCNGCGYEYDPGVGDLEGEVSPGTLFENLPEEWTCPACGEEKDMFIEA